MRSFQDDFLNIVAEIALQGSGMYIDGMDIQTALEKAGFAPFQVLNELNMVALKLGATRVYNQIGYNQVPG